MSERHPCESGNVVLSFRKYQGSKSWKSANTGEVKVKSGILRLMLLSIPLVPLMAHAGTDNSAPQSQAASEKRCFLGICWGAKTQQPAVTSPAVDSREETNKPAAIPPPPAPVQEANKPADIPTPPPVTVTETKVPAPVAAATFDSGETEPTGVDAKLHPTRQLKDGATNPGSVRSDTSSVPSAPSAPSETYTPPNTARSLRDVKSSARSGKSSARSTAKATAQSARIQHTRTDMASTMSGTTAEVMPVTQEPLALDAKSHWKIRSGERLSEAFARWSKIVGWQLSWEPEDMIAQADLDLEDTFTGVTGKVIDALNRGGADIQAKFYASNHMLRIMARK